MLPHDDGVFDELLHAVNQPIAVPRRHEAAAALGVDVAGDILGFFGGGELSIGFWEGRLVGDGEHAHPTAEDAQRVDGIEGLRATGDLGDGESAALRGAHGAGAQRDPVDLVLEHARLRLVLGQDRAGRGRSWGEGAGVGCTHEIPVLLG